MTTPNMILLYVQDPAKSVDFYADILNTKPLEQSPTFAMFQMNESIVLGLWAKHAVEPKVTATAGATELGVHVEGRRRCYPRRLGKAQCADCPSPDKDGFRLYLRRT